MRDVARSYPDFRVAEALGRRFEAVNERRKVQITDPERFPEPVRILAAILAGKELRDALSAISGIPNLLWDDTFTGGGMHLMATAGRLDVHVDFNRLAEGGLYRRLNLIVYLNETWESAWGGALELWDADVKRCVRSIEPRLNRCVLFATTGASFHGVTQLRCPPEIARQSFAVYYYSTEPPLDRREGVHSTLFRARPDEPIRRYVLMPAERLQRRLVERYRRARRIAGRMLR